MEKEISVHEERLQKSYVFARYFSNVSTQILSLEKKKCSVLDHYIHAIIHTHCTHHIHTRAHSDTHADIHRCDD